MPKKSKRASKPPRDIALSPEDSFGYVVRDTFRAFVKVLQAKIAEEGVTVGTWFFLRALWQEEGLPQRELCRRIGLMESTAVTALDLMERHGLIRRKRDDDDRRRSLVFLTAKGRALQNRLLPHAIRTNDIAMADISADDRAHVRRILKRMRSNLNAHLALATKETGK